jgi:type VI secretion system protein ImpH
MASESREPDADLAASTAEPHDEPTPPPDYSPEDFSDVPLDQLLFQEPYKFEFFAALRVIGKLAERQPLGTIGDGESSADATTHVRFRALQSLAFPPSEIWDIVRPEAPEQPIEMTVAFLGLTGPLGALPRPYTELVMQRIRKGDRALRDFLDLFNQRLITLFAKAGEKYRFYLQYELAARAEARRRREGPQRLRGFLIEDRARLDRFSQVLLDLGGIGTPLLRYRDKVRSAPVRRTEIDDQVLRHYSGLFAQSHRNPASLGRMLAEYFGVPVAIVQFVGQWLALPPEFQTCLQSRPRTPGGNDRSALAALPARSTSRPDAKLGENAVVGSRTWEVQGRFRVRLGPLTFDQFQNYLPVGQSFRAMAQLVRLYVGGTLDFDIQPTLAGPEAPWLQFGAKGPRSPRLGWNTWLRNKPFDRPVTDAIFRVPDAVSFGNASEAV